MQLGLLGRKRKVGGDVAPPILETSLKLSDIGNLWSIVSRRPSCFRAKFLLYYGIISQTENELKPAIAAMHGLHSLVRFGD